MHTSHFDSPAPENALKVGRYLSTLLNAYPTLTVSKLILNAVVAYDTMLGRDTTLETIDTINDADLLVQLHTFSLGATGGFTTPTASTASEPLSAPTSSHPAMKFNLPVEDLPTSQELFATVKVLKATGADRSVYGPFEEQALRTQHAERIIDRLAKTLTETIWPKSKFEERGKGDQERYKEAAANLVVEMEKNGWSRLPADGGAVLSHAEVEVLTNVLRRTQTNDQNRDLIRRFVGAKR